MLNEVQIFHEHSLYSKVEISLMSDKDNRQECFSKLDIVMPAILNKVCELGMFVSSLSVNAVIDEHRWM